MQDGGGIPALSSIRSQNHLITMVKLKKKGQKIVSKNEKNLNFLGDL